eukprot:m.82677 g.82677  ORF g.82677 m.82677 type:complete len:594 (-) comp14313_c0_seq1:27-1808(-)
MSERKISISSLKTPLLSRQDNDDLHVDHTDAERGRPKSNAYAESPSTIAARRASSIMTAKVPHLDDGEDAGYLNVNQGYALSDLTITADDEDDEEYLIIRDDIDGLSSTLAGERPKDFIPRLRWHVHRFVDNIFVRLFGVCLVLVDLTLVIVRLSENHGNLHQNNNGTPYGIVSHCIVSYFLFELALRIFALTPQYFFTKPLEVIDFIVIVVSAIFEFAFNFARVVTFGRLVRLVILVRLVTEHYNLRKAARLKIAENKRRYRQDGFDLDLTYVTNRIIAMSFPSSGARALYRNPIREVARFFKRKHDGHYMIFNCCSERDYNHAIFDNHVDNCPIDDHNVPLMPTMMAFCEKAGKFLQDDPQNVVAIHCKGGKGRTGTMICALMLYCDKFDTAKDSLDYFAMRRTDLDVSKKFQGVQTPSQGRYVGYMEEVVRKYNRQLPPPVTRVISMIRVVSLLVHPSNSSGAKTLSFDVFCDNAKVFDFDVGQSMGIATVQMLTSPEGNIPIVEFDVENLMVHGDVKIKFKGNGLPKRYDHCPFYFWFNPSFHQQDSKLVLTREVLDNPHKPKMWKYYDEHFAVEVYFSDTGARTESSA